MYIMLFIVVYLDVGIPLGRVFSYRSGEAFAMSSAAWVGGLPRGEPENAWSLCLAARRLGEKPPPDAQDDRKPHLPTAAPGFTAVISRGVKRALSGVVPSAGPPLGTAQALISLRLSIVSRVKMFTYKKKPHTHKTTARCKNIYV
jgi:hypothetical protein